MVKSICAAYPFYTVMNAVQAQLSIVNPIVFMMFVSCLLINGEFNYEVQL